MGNQNEGQRHGARVRAHPSAMDLPLKLWPHPLYLHLTKTPARPWTLDHAPSCLSLAPQYILSSGPPCLSRLSPVPASRSGSTQPLLHSCLHPLSPGLTSLALVPPHFRLHHCPSIHPNLVLGPGSAPCLHPSTFTPSLGPALGTGPTQSLSPSLTI